MKTVSLVRSLVLSLLGLVLGGCAQVHVVPEPGRMDRPAPGKGMVVFYREDRFLGSVTEYRVKDGFAPIGGLRTGTYFVHQADPGRHFFQASTEITEQVIVDVRAGGVYYVRGGVRPGVVITRPSLELVPREVGRSALAKLRRVEMNPKKKK